MILYIPFAGDLYTLTTDDKGNVIKCMVSRDNNSSFPEPLELQLIPDEVIEAGINKMIKLGRRKRATDEEDD